MKRIWNLFLALALVFTVSIPQPVYATTNLNNPTNTIAVSVLVTATQILVARTDNHYYQGVFIEPTDGDIAIGGAGVTALNGLPVPSGTIVYLDWTYGGSWYAIRTGGANVNLRILPVF